MSSAGNVIYIKETSNTENLLRLPLLNIRIIITIYTYNRDSMYKTIDSILDFQSLLLKYFTVLRK